MSDKLVARLGDAVGEVNWIPFDRNGEVLSTLEDDLVAVTPAELRERACGSDQQVIAVCGGELKLAALEAAMINPFCSTLVTDVINARRLLDSKVVGTSR